MWVTAILGALQGIAKIPEAIEKLESSYNKIANSITEYEMEKLRREVDEEVTSIINASNDDEVHASVDALSKLLSK